MTSAELNVATNSNIEMLEDFTYIHQMVRRANTTVQAQIAMHKCARTINRFPAEKNVQNRIDEM